LDFGERASEEDGECWRATGESDDCWGSNAAFARTGDEEGLALDLRVEVRDYALAFCTEAVLRHLDVA